MPCANRLAWVIEKLHLVEQQRLPDRGFQELDLPGRLVGDAEAADLARGLKLVEGGGRLPPARPACRGGAAAERRDSRSSAPSATRRRLRGCVRPRSRSRRGPLVMLMPALLCSVMRSRSAGVSFIASAASSSGAGAAIDVGMVEKVMSAASSAAPTSFRMSASLILAMRIRPSTTLGTVRSLCGTGNVFMGWSAFCGVRAFASRRKAAGARTGPRHWASRRGALGVGLRIWPRQRRGARHERRRPSAARLFAHFLADIHPVGIAIERAIAAAFS